jgi:hypothetical protein
MESESAEFLVRAAQLNKEFDRLSKRPKKTKAELQLSIRSALLKQDELRGLERLLKHGPTKPESDAHRSARELIDALNKIEERSPEEQKALREIDRLLTLLLELRRKSVCGEPIRPDELNPVNEILARYKWITQYVWHPDKIKSFPAFAGMWSGSESEAMAKYLAQALADIVVHLDDLLDLIRRCDHCGRYFLGERRDSREYNFCTTEHRKAHWRQQPEAKEKQREYARAYYRDVLSPVTSRTVRNRKRRRS